MAAFKWNLVREFFRSQGHGKTTRSSPSHANHFATDQEHQIWAQGRVDDALRLFASRGRTDIRPNSLATTLRAPNGRTITTFDLVSNSRVDNFTVSLASGFPNSPGGAGMSVSLLPLDAWTPIGPQVTNDTMALIDGLRRMGAALGFNEFQAGNVPIEVLRGTLPDGYVRGRNSDDLFFNEPSPRRA